MQRQPRDRSETHLAFIRTLPCVVCGNNIETEAAHIRMADRSVAKPMTGIATKCDDRFTVPLCGTHHRQQHDDGNEHRWWLSKHIDPIKAALAIYSVSGDYERGEQIVSACNQFARGWARKMGFSESAVIAHYNRLMGVVFPYDVERGRLSRENVAKKAKAQQEREAKALAAMNERIARGIPRYAAFQTARSEGATLQAIADQRGVSRQAVDQYIAYHFGR